MTIAIILASILDSLQFVYFKTGQTSEETITIVPTTTHQGIYSQDSSLICQILFNPLEIVQLNERSLTNIADMIIEGKLYINQDTKVLYKNC